MSNRSPILCSFDVSAFFSILLLVATTPVFAASSIDTQDRLLCPAELKVLQADAIKLANASLPAAHQRGLKNRISVGLATLVFICRRYVAVVGLGTSDNAVFTTQSDFISRIRALTFNADDLARLIHALDELIEIAPLKTDRFKLDRAGDQDEIEAGNLYTTYCHGCHKATDHASENPAFSLKKMAKSQEDVEFYARMLLGVRGTSDIGLSNPLSPVEIGAMTRYLRAN